MINIFWSGLIKANKGISNKDRTRTKSMIRKMVVQILHVQNQKDKENNQEHSMCNAVRNETVEGEYCSHFCKKVRISINLCQKNQNFNQFLKISEDCNATLTFNICIYIQDTVIIKYLYIHTYIHSFIVLHVFVHIYIYIYIYINNPTYTYIHTYIHIHTYTYIHIYI